MTGGASRSGGERSLSSKRLSARQVVLAAPRQADVAFTVVGDGRTLSLSWSFARRAWRPGQSWRYFLGETSMKAESGDESLSHPLIGTTLRGTYRVVRLIDRGGTGSLFEAEHLRLKRPVAVKVLPLDLRKEQHALSRFRNEAESIALLQHPNVVQVIDFDVTEQQQPYIVMELLQGETLAQKMEREGRLPLRFAVRVAVQTASALNAVHGAHMVHRDLKPGNVFLSELSGEGAWVKLLDFGISKRNHGRQGLTGEHDVMGTPDYMSPELALGHAASADHRSDQYSLAVIVYEMLSGRVPFVGEHELDILSQVISQRAPALALLVPALPPHFSQVVDKAMSKLPADRFGSMDDFALALSQAAGIAPPPASPGGQTLRLTSDPAALSPETAVTTRPAAVATPRAPRTDTGLREHRTPGRPAPRPAGLSARAALNGLLARCERAQAHEGAERAAELLEQALSMAEAMSEAEASSALASSRKLMSEVLEASIGDQQRRVRPVSVPRVSSARFSPQEAFLLATAEQGFTIEELIDSTSLPRLQALRLVARLLRAGLLA
jgi:serine/threonine-protein kinase